MNRITSKIQQVNRRGEGAFIPYLMAGDPTPERSMDYIRALADGGADIIELGVPFSDPVADGPTIQAAGVRAMSSTRGPADALDLVRKVGEEVEIPLILMSYYNPIL
ncbi:tryptophan synthase subunit alpha, partial [Candidatus Bipolaricaulota bacterium]|nr:tryptophan synthase subunit alpha [Candidatus Bipolaricaulota bacterium]